ncbi:MFS transporter [Pseudohyphozyma bogoriensis]|nr:MFS transporter [Pseudohyphozyma bogoriensis]
MASPSLSRTSSSTLDDQHAADSHAAVSTPKTAPHSSTEQFDLGGDRDLEKRLEGGGKGADTPTSTAAGPATLAHDDPENPRNWRTRKKILVNFALCIWVLSLTYSSTAYVASLPSIETQFNASQEVAILGVTFIVLGLAAGPLLFGPATFSWGVAFAPNTAGLLTMRFLMGFFGSASINNVPASIGDYTVPANRGPYSILYALMAFGGPALGPLCSSFIQTDAGFRWNLRVMAIFVSVFSIIVACVPETHGPTLYKWKLKREGKAPPALKTGEVMAVFKTALSRPILYLLTEPTVTLVSLYLTVLYSILYAFFEAFTVVWLEIRGFKETSYGLTYISLGLGFLFGCVLLGTLGVRSYRSAVVHAMETNTKVQPEARLGLAYVAGFVAPASLFIFAWTAPFPHVHWIAPCIAEFLFGASMLLIFTAFIPYLIDVYLTTAASALAAGMASRALVASVFPLFTIQMYHNLTVQGATSLLAGLTLLMAPLPFVFRRYGTWMREHSKYAVVQ